jgi:predicted RNase H-like HicB family nuclease
MADAEAHVRRFTLQIRDEHDGMLWAEVEELPGCFASGTDMDELLEAAAEAIGMYLGDAAGDVAVEAAPDQLGKGNVVPLPGRHAGHAVMHYAVDRAEILLEA